MSKELDLDVFCDGKRQKQEAASIESYPEGFVPPHFKQWQRAKQAGDTGVAGEQAAVDEREAQQSSSADDA